MMKRNSILEIRRFSVRKRITLMVILISVVPVIIISIFSYSKAYISVQRTAYGYSSKMMRLVGSLIESRISPRNLFSGEFLKNHAFEDLSSYNGDQAASLILQPARKHLRGLAFRSADGTGVFHWGAETGSGPPGWELMPHGEPLLLLTIPIDSSVRAGEGTLQAVFSSDLLSECLNVFDLENHDKLLLAGPGGTMLTSKNAHLSVLEKHKLKKLAKTEVDGVPSCPLNDFGSFLSCMRIPRLGWNLIFIASYAEMMKPLQSIFWGILFGTIVLLNFSFAVIVSIDRPLTALVHSFSEAARMNFNVSLEDECVDELGILGNIFNEICGEMREMLDKVEREQEAKRKAEIKMLQAQINPHFLFNTLDSFRFTAMVNNVPALAEGVGALSHLLRSSILKDNSYVSLRAELNTIEDYLTLQRIRSCETIRLHEEITGEAAAARIMKLLLQPIVENSVVHGIRENECLDIVIHAEVEKGQLHISISDNGRGFDMTGRPGSSCPFRNSRMSGIGLRNVRDRLTLAYRDNHHFEIQSQPGIGTRVSLALPYEKAEERSDV